MLCGEGPAEQSPCSADQSQPPLEERVRCKARHSEGINNKSNSAVIRSPLPIRLLLNFGNKKCIYIHFCLSTWLQQSAEALMHCIVDCWLELEGKCILLHECNSTEKWGETKQDIWSLWWVLSAVIDLNSNTQKHRHTHPQCMPLLASLKLLWGQSDGTQAPEFTDKVMFLSLINIKFNLIHQFPLLWISFVRYDMWPNETHHYIEQIHGFFWDLHSRNIRDNVST